MAWDGYFEYDGNEIINVARTEQYAEHAKVGWFKPTFKNDALPYMLGDGLRYTTPLLDNAPWTDPDIPESYDFLGFYPLGIDGIEGSTRGSTVVESLMDGGYPGRLRNATKSVVFNGILIGLTDAATEYGMRWLKKALEGGACGPGASSACNGATLCYLSSEPDMEIPSETRGVEASLDGGTASIEGDDTDIDGGSTTALADTQFEGGSAGSTGNFTTSRTEPFDYRPQTSTTDPEDCLRPYLRSLTKVLINNGPTRTARRPLADGGEVWNVQFTAVAGNPWELSAEMPVISGLLDPNVTVPWAGGVEPEGGTIDLDGYLQPDEDCGDPIYTPIYDPEHPAIIVPPAPPSVPLGGFTPPLAWRRRQFTVPKQFVPLWGEVVPKVTVHARYADLRNLRMRFYADPYKVGDISDDPCAYCGDIIISYVPVDHSLVFDAAERSVYIIAAGGGRQRADSLVFKSDGTPFDWPSLTCGFGYVVTLDLPQTQEPPVVDLSLFSRAV